MFVSYYLHGYNHMLGLSSHISPHFTHNFHVFPISITSSGTAIFWSSSSSNEVFSFRKRERNFFYLDCLLSEEVCLSFLLSTLSITLFTILPTKYSCPHLRQEASSKTG